SLAIIADIHGNLWALRAVLEDIERRDVRRIINLGDHLTGPLDPAGTAALLAEHEHEMLSICGNDDRVLLFDVEELTPTQRLTRERLGPAVLDWLRALTDTAVLGDELFACHGDLFDAPYLLEHVDATGVALRSTAAIEASIASAAIAQPVILS